MIVGVPIFFAQKKRCFCTIVLFFLPSLGHTQVQSKDDFEKSSIVSELPSHDDPGELTFEEGAGKRCCCLDESFSMIDIAGGMGRHRFILEYSTLQC